MIKSITLGSFRGYGFELSCKSQRVGRGKVWFGDTVGNPGPFRSVGFIILRILTQQGPRLRYSWAKPALQAGRTGRGSCRSHEPKLCHLATPKSRNTGQLNVNFYSFSGRDRRGKGLDLEVCQHVGIRGIINKN